MTKQMYLFYGIDNESYPAFSQRILQMAATLSENKHIQKLKVVYTKQAPPRFSVIPFKKEKVAVMTVFLTSDINEIKIGNETGFAGSYLVEEAIPVSYEKSWDDLRETPGVCLLTLFRQKPGIDYDTFIHRWHNSHTPLSLKIHPLWNYNRNVVIRRLSDYSGIWDGIVEEQFRTASDLLNPLKFFGNPFIMFYNMLRVYFDTISFLDYKTIKPYLATEVHLKS